MDKHKSCSQQQEQKRTRSPFVVEATQTVNQSVIEQLKGYINDEWVCKDQDQQPLEQLFSFSLIQNTK